MVSVSRNPWKNEPISFRNSLKKADETIHQDDSTNGSNMNVVDKKHIADRNYLTSSFIGDMRLLRGPSHSRRTIRFQAALEFSVKVVKLEVGMRKNM